LKIYSAELSDGFVASLASLGRGAYGRTQNVEELFTAWSTYGKGRGSDGGGYGTIKLARTCLPKL
jgi:hypothetical protein